MGSLKVSAISVGLFTIAATSVGACVSGTVENTLFCAPGVPPAGAMEARQFAALEQGVPGLTRSSVQPPSSLMGSGTRCIGHGIDGRIVRRGQHERIAVVVQGRKPTAPIVFAPGTAAPP